MFAQQPNFVTQVTNNSHQFVQEPDIQSFISLTAHFSVAECDISYWQRLFGSQGINIDKMRQKRCAEFVAGRYLAWLAIKQLTGTEHEVLAIGEDRAPVWPKGMIGCISHSNGQVVVMVKRQSQQSLLGVDIEKCLSIEQAKNLHQEFINVRELAVVEQSKVSETLSFSAFVTLIFSAKETIYKAYYPLVKTFFSFDAVELVSHKPNQLIFKITDAFPSLDAAFLAGGLIAVNWTLQDDMVVTWLSSG
ncbi:phosphopantetheinyl transferase [Catenovulum agarivorans DS-2]|uniref:Enterobactin synthase component D n=1 Tax=Catenovulum agarivorans DS-2 TaxID=1328313 RepID=W7QMB2_9ALTE|nr:4'-phosphopantetheinyl transferase superfamily protein [Catenovulum agarivorans]EWH10072.1 phosphopantetheinyl transferase [Catenovulum agarivorans DS-2]